MAFRAKFDVGVAKFFVDSGRFPEYLTLLAKWSSTKWKEELLGAAVWIGIVIFKLY